MMIHWTDNLKNNLDMLIKSSGKTKRQIAELKGVTPETLSRHIHSRIDMSLSDAEEYAQILNTNVMTVLFPDVPVKVIGKVIVHSDETVSRYSNHDGYGWAHMDGQHWPNLGVVHWSCEKNYNGRLRAYQDTWTIIDMSKGNFDVSSDCYNSMSYVHLNEPIEVFGRLCEHLVGVLYPEPEGSFAIQLSLGEKLKVFKGIKACCAYPLLSIMHKPELRRGKIIWNFNDK